MDRISIQGARGSFHDIVARTKFPGESEIIESGTAHQVFEDVKKGRVDYGVVAIENSFFGSFLENYDLILKHDVKIAGEVYLRVVLDLIAMPDVIIEDISEVYTHPMAMTESHAFLEKHPNMTRIESDDTAGSVAMIKEQRLRNAAAIAAPLAAEIYGMNVLAHDIETGKKNYTRFLIIAKELQHSEKSDKTSIVIRAKNQAGSLYHCLKCFADETVNLSKLESRPIIGQAWDYYFYLDFEDNMNSPAAQRALTCLRKVTNEIKILGSYQRDRSLAK